jgi:SAM-dependent methyltransferase
MDRADLMVMFEQPFWEERFGGPETVWSGNPNVTLVEQASDLTPGRALEVACGEGGDTVWLAERGWQVTAVDFSQAGLDRTAAHAAQRGVGDKVTFEQHDLRTWQPPAAAYDLVTCHFFHLPDHQVLPAFARLSTAVAPGGTLLIAGHDLSDLETGIDRPAMPDMLYTAEDIAGVLDPADWELQTVGKRPKQAEQDGKTFTLHIAVLKARRRP